MTSPQPASTNEAFKKALQTIDIVDELIHSITRRHIPDYPEATIAINKIDTLIAKAVVDELEMVEGAAIEGDKDEYIEARIAALKDQTNTDLGGGKG